MKNKSDGAKDILTIILVFSVFVLWGFVKYKEYVYNDEISKLNGKIDNLEKQIKNVDKCVDTSKVEIETKKNVVGYYKSGTLTTLEHDCDGEPFESTTEFHLMDDGTYKFVSLSSCDGAKQEGNYTYDDDKLVLSCDPDKSVQCDGTDLTKREYTINNDGSLSSGNSVYKKVTKDELQVLYK